MSQDLKQTIIQYFEGRLFPDEISEIQKEFYKRFNTQPRRAFVSQVFHSHKSSSKVWECIRSVALRNRERDLKDKKKFTE